MRLGSYQAIAHGADSVLYFQWRASRGGHERFHSAMLPHSGTGARTWQEVEALGKELPRIAEVAGSHSYADVAVLFDWDAWWGLETTYGLPRNDFDYAQIVTDHYRPLLESHYAVDLVSFDSDLSRYRVVVVPNAYLVSDRFADALERFVEQGGTLVCSFFSGVVDLNNQVRQPAYPGAFRRLIGAYIDEYWPARDGETFEVTFADGSTATCDWWQDSIQAETARVVASYVSGSLQGRPAIIDNALGSGRVLYVGTRLDDVALRDTVCAAVRSAGVCPWSRVRRPSSKRVGGSPRRPSSCSCSITLTPRPSRSPCRPKDSIFCPEPPSTEPSCSRRWPQRWSGPIVRSETLLWSAGQSARDGRSVPVGDEAERRRGAGAEGAVVRRVVRPHDEEASRSSSAPGPCPLVDDPLRHDLLAGRGRHEVEPVDSQPVEDRAFG